MVCWKTCFDTGMGSFCFPWRLKNQDSKNWSRCSRLAHPLRWSCLHLNFLKVWVSLDAAWVSGKFTIFSCLVQWPSSRKFFWLIKKFSSNSFACLWKTGSSPSENVKKLPSYVDTVWDAKSVTPLQKVLPICGSRKHLSIPSSRRVIENSKGVGGCLRSQLNFKGKHERKLEFAMGEFKPK